ncbi:AraC family transcriptional regulator [Adhaeribacter swui]|uniref:AraC family transcriptional regulator n=1 Tax=Adhaeribacter swui TaxID=2086471 RepID=A0A7G7GCQ5_9BACT|nr:helix-turn-helix domain-containing protein [Adhaeribacter swui]QNF34939.1 AraC family transcriptional regulator [Adhaeribacter swui]
MNLITLLQIILAAGALLGLVLAILLFIRKPNQLANRLLSLLILCLALQSFLIAFDTQEFLEQRPQLSRISWLLPMVFGPMLYLFIRKLIARNPRLFPIEIIHFIPVVVALFYLLPYFIQSQEKTIAFLSNLDASRHNDFNLIRQVTLFQVLFYLVYSLKTLAQYDKRIVNTFSNLENKKLIWLKKVVYVLLAIFLAAVLAVTLNNWYLPVLTELYHYYLHFLIVIILVFWIGFKTLYQKQIFLKNKAHATLSQDGETYLNEFEKDLIIPDGPVTEPMGVPGLPKKYRKYTLKPAALQKYYERLNAIMETQKPYRQSNLTIQELADMLQMPRQYLLYLIHEQLGKSFYDFINQYRIAEVQAFLAESKEHSLTKQELAQSAGFTSEAAMEAVFMQLTGKSATEY